MDPELRQRERRRRRYLKVGGGIVLALVLLFVLGRPAGHAIKAWQARRHAGKAFSLIEAEKWDLATAEARAGYQLWPSEPAAIRAVARLLSRTRQTDALAFWKALREKQALTRQDLRDEVAIALLAGETTVAQGAIQELLGKNKGGPGSADWLLAAQFSAQNGAPEQAATDLEKIVANPKSTERQLLQASILQFTLTSPDNPAAAKIRADAWARLTKLARGRDAVALDALTILAQRVLTRPNEIVIDPAGMPDEELTHSLQTHPLTRTAQKLLALDLQFHADPTRRATIIQEAIASALPSDNEALSTLARWLNGKGEFQRALDTIPLQRALQTRELFLQRLDALGALDRWEEIRALLENERFPLDDVIEYMYLARCYTQLGQPVAAQNNWQRALESAHGDPAKLMTLADYAEKNGAGAIALTACDAAIATTSKLRAAWQTKLRLTQPTRDTEKIYRVLADMLKLWPNDNAIQNDEAYLRLLLAGAKDEAQSPKPEGTSLNHESAGGTTAVSSETDRATSSPITNNQELITVAQVAEQLVQREPASLPHRTLLALARLRLGKPADALAVYNGLRIPRNVSSPSAVVVHAAVLAANGKEEDARTEAASLKSDDLLPEEKALIAKLL